ncbi:MATE family efflux transporter [Mediterraneibacter agrestimuris]|uniref:MATE family efflux transporter n=1 Tax=Mediterraneibacter agrestimuris TaxID=2941333 RepID=UPI0020426C11|nr:MATE family efflux transporter [Mediterraneibacter agrestimuris]
MEKVTKENKMGVMPIPKLIVTMSLPIVISMLVQALYNIIDSIFVAQINENALTAVSLVFPVQNLMIAIAVGTGVGINALLSRNLGEKNFEDANLAARNGLFLALINSVFMALIGILASKTFFTMQTQEQQIIQYGTQYMTIITVLSIGIFMGITLERLLQATGRTFYTMLTQGLGAIINIILDPIMIFGLLGFPRMGVAGAALATVTGQFIALFLSLYFNIRKNPDININMKGFRPSKRVIGSIYQVGVPAIIMQAIGSVMVFGMNKILLMFSSTATAVFGVYFKLQSFIFMPIFGLNNGIIPIIAYNYGARNKKRILSSVNLGITISVSIMFLGVLLFQLFPAQLLGFFDASEHMLEIGVPALRIISLCFIPAGYSILVGSVFQSLGNGTYSLFISVARQLLVILPVAFFLAKVFGLHMVWWAIPSAEIVSFTMSVLLYRRIRRLKINPLQD